MRQVVRSRRIQTTSSAVSWIRRRFCSTCFAACFTTSFGHGLPRIAPPSGLQTVRVDFVLGFSHKNRSLKTQPDVYLVSILAIHACATWCFPQSWLCRLYHLTLQLEACHRIGSPSLTKCSSSKQWYSISANESRNVQTVIEVCSSCQAPRQKTPADRQRGVLMSSTVDLIAELSKATEGNTD